MLVTKSLFDVFYESLKNTVDLVYSVREIW